LYLQGIGDIKIKLHRPTEGAIKTVTLKREGRQWFAIFVCDAPTHPLPATHQSVGLDLGLTHFVTLDTGETIANPRSLRKAQAKLRRAQRSLSRKKRGGSIVTRHECGWRRSIAPCETRVATSTTRKRESWRTVSM
jgi:putative transposase